MPFPVQSTFHSGFQQATKLLSCCIASTIIMAYGESPTEDKSSIVIDGPEAYYPGVIAGGFKANDAYVDGHFSITAPVWSTLGADATLSGDYVFIEPYISWGEQGEVASSLGLGWRHLFGTQSVKVLTEHDDHQAGLLEEGLIVGANVFVDLLDTHFDNRFWQLGIGVEASTRYLELHGNYYIPLSDRQLAEEIHRSTFLGTATKVSYDEPFGQGHTIQQDATFTKYSFTLEQLFRRYEDGMEGWDAEMALLIPWLDRWLDVQVIGGYYSFDNQPFGPQAGSTGKVEGWKAGVEVRPVPAIVLTGMWYEDDKLTGSDWIVGMNLELPFEAGDLGDGKGFWGRIGDAFRPRRRHLIERIAEPVRRQNVAVKLGESVEEVTSERHVVTKVVSQTEKRIVLANTVVFVDNVNGTAGNPGTYERPLNTVQGGENQSGTLFGNSGIVFVQGGGASYAEDVLVSQSTAFYGSGRGYPTLGGLAFHGRNMITPVMTPSGTGFSATGVGALTVSGFTINGGAAVGIFASGVGAVQVVGNTFVNQTTNAINLFWPAGTSGSAYVAENVINSVGAGIVIAADPGASATARVISNTVSFAGTGITLNGNGSLRAIVEGNNILNITNDGILVNGGAAQINGRVNNVIQGVGGKRYTGGATGQFIINNTIVNSFPAFP